MRIRRDKAPHAPWPKVRLGDVVVEVRDRINSSQIAREQYITTENMVKDRGGVVVAESKPESIGLVGYKTGDVLIANIRPYLKKIWLANQFGGCSSDVVVYRSTTAELSSEYLYSALSSDEFFEYVMRKTRGTKMPRGDRDWMSHFEIPLPPLSVQKEIVARLEKELAEVDRMAKGFECLAADADALFKAELKEAFEDIKRSGAKTRRLGEVCSKIGSGATPLGGKSTYLEKGISLIRSQNVLDLAFSYQGLAHISDKQAEKLDGVSVKSKDVLLNITGDSVARCCVVDDGCLDARVNQHVAIIRIKDKAQIKPEFLAHYLVAEKDFLLIEAQKGSTRKALTKSFIENIELPHLDFAEQSAIVAKLDAVREKCAKLKSAAEEGLKTAALLRKAILKEAFE